MTASHLSKCHRAPAAVHLIVLLLAIPVFLKSVTTADATTYIVDPGPLTIQDAMAQAADGDSVLLRPGTYHLDRSVRIKAGVILKSTAGPLPTILDTDYRFPGLIAQDLSAPATIEGLTFTHCLAPLQLTIGGGILCLYSSPVIRDCLFINNVASSFDGEGGGGSAVGVIGGTPTIEDNTMLGNISASGAILLEETQAIVRGNVIAYNGPGAGRPFGYGLSCFKAEGSIVTGNLFWGNRPFDFDPYCLSLPQNNYFDDPLICDPMTPDWRVKPNSPIAPGGKLSGLGVFLGTCDPVSTESTSWGKLKVMYR